MPFRVCSGSSLLLTVFGGGDEYMSDVALSVTGVGCCVTSSGRLLYISAIYGRIHKSVSWKIRNSGRRKGVGTYILDPLENFLVFVIRPFLRHGWVQDSLVSSGIRTWLPFIQPFLRVLLRCVRRRRLLPFLRDSPFFFNRPQTDTKLP